MTYEEWLNTIEELKHPNLSIDNLNKIKNTSLNENINPLLIPKIENLVKERLNNSINKIILNLSEIFNDINYLDLTLLNFKKEINYILEIISIKQLPEEKQKELKDMIKDESNNVIEILNKEAQKLDYTGALSSIINNYRIKWSE